ncbi:MAG: hypothetical protein QOI41_3585, partial [Myxococcales bacterium]|nr:hypothetical protein [Myxococcales bacterium]
MAARRFAWVLNLDADLELASPRAHGYTPKRTVLEAMKPYVAMLAKSSLLGAEDRVLDDAFMALSASERASFTGRAFSPTPRAVAALRRAGVEPEPHPGVEVLRRVNSRAFSAALGQTLPGATFVTDLEAARAVFAESPPIGNGWRVKRNFGMTGRGQRVLTRAADDADLAFLRAGLAEGGVQIEPNVSIHAEYGIHGRIAADGAASLGVVVRQLCDARGAWLSTVPLTSLTQDDLETAGAIAVEGRRVADALARAGYFGPFGVDSYVYRSENGNLDIQLRSEINARYSMGY